MPRLSFGKKLTFGGMAILLLPLIITGGFSVWHSSDALVSAEKSRSLMLAKTLAEMTNLILSQELKTVSVIAADPHIRILMETIGAETGKAPAAAQALIGFMEHIHSRMGDDYELMILADRNGRLIADSLGGKYIGISIDDRDYFQRAKAGKAGVSEPVRSKGNGEPVIPVCAPIFDRDGEFLGAIANVLLMNLLFEYIYDFRVAGTGYAYMVDAEGIMIAHPDPEVILKLNTTTLEGMEEIAARMTALESGMMTYSFRGADKIAGYAPVPLTGWSVAVTREVADFLTAPRQIRNLVLWVGALFILLTILGISFFSRRISGRLSGVTRGLIASSEEVSSASAELNAAGGHLSETASSQAAAVEETSASLHQIAAMSRQNADHSKGVSDSAAAIQDAVLEADGMMKELSAAMQETGNAGQKVNGIISTIEDIAFQTNLLSLNAAVEAARVGEAGSGFAVVASEVRNLALRTTKSAKETTELVQGNLSHIEKSMDLAGRTVQAFERVTEQLESMRNRIQEIAAASDEQARGVEQMSRAMTDMDESIQKNAAEAQQTAASAEELNTQADRMMAFVEELKAIIGGKVQG